MRLPSVAAADPNCAYCSARGVDTAFGIVLVVPAALVATLRPSVVVPPLWRYVYDHNGLEKDVCLGGYQEFGQRACVRLNYGGYIGIATAAINVSASAALIDLQPGINGESETCCPFLPN